MECVAFLVFLIYILDRIIPQSLRHRLNECVSQESECRMITHSSLFCLSALVVEPVCLAAGMCMFAFVSAPEPMRIVPSTCRSLLVSHT